jgi:hypothetical protein
MRKFSRISGALLTILITFIIIPTPAHARGGGDQIGAIIFFALLLGGAYVLIMLMFGGLKGYSKIIGKLFGVSEKTENSDWWPWLCIYGSAFIFMFFSVLFRE